MMEDRRKTREDINSIPRSFAYGSPKESQGQDDKMGKSKKLSGLCVLCGKSYLKKQSQSETRQK
jgi:hypothetical protein